MRIIYQNFLLIAFCIFLDSAQAQNKKFKTTEVHKDEQSQILLGHTYNIPNRPFDAVVSEKGVKLKHKCKGKYCQNENDANEEFRQGEEENNYKFTKVYRKKCHKYGNDDTSDEKIIKSHKEREIKRARDSVKVGHYYDQKEDTESSSKRRIIENVIVVKDKLGHLKKKFENIEKMQFDSEETSDFFKKNNKKPRNGEKEQIYSKSFRNEEGDSSEEEKPKKVKSKIKDKVRGSENINEKRKQKSNPVANDSSRNQKISKNINSSKENDRDKTESNETIIESVDNTEDRDKKTCEKMEGSRKKLNGNCNSDEDVDEEDFHTKKFKFSIKYAHEKKKLSSNRNDHLVKRIHRIDNKKHRFVDDDSDEEDELPKRLYHVMDDEE